MEKETKEKKKIDKKKIIKTILIVLLCMIIYILFGLILVWYNSMTNNNASKLEETNEINKAYSIDNNGNLVGDNIFDINNANMSYGYDYQATASDWGKILDIPVIANTTYSCSSSIGRISFNHGNIISSYNDTTFTTTSNTTSVCLFFYIGDDNKTLYEIFKYLMINIGSTALPWEPYGVWYSQNNYNTIQNNYNDLLESYMQLELSDDNILRLAYKADLINNDNAILKSVYTLTNNIHYGVNYIDTAINFPEEYENIKAIRILYNNNIKVNENYIFSIVTFGYDYTIQFYNDDSLTYTITTNNLINEDNYRSFFIIETPFEFNKIIINNDGTNFTEDSPLLNLITYNTSIQLQQQYKNGYDEGYSNGNNEGKRQGREQGYENGYNEGYNKGAQEDFSSNAFLLLIEGIFSYPINFISSFLNFEFMGINLLAVLTFIITIGIVVFVIKRFK